MIFVYQLSVYFVLIISSDFSEVSINTSVTLSFAAVLALFLQTFDKFFLSRFVLISYFISYIFLQLTLLILREGFCLNVQQGYHLFLKMQVSAMQYRETVGIFNNQKLIINLRFELPSCLKLSNNLPNYDANYISLLFDNSLITFLFSKGCVSKISTNYLFQFSCCSIFFWACSCGYAVV